MPSITFPAWPGGDWPGALTPGDPGGTSAPPPPPPPTNPVNHWVGSSSNAVGGTGLTLVQPNGANIDGDALVCFIGWNGQTFPQIGNVSVADDAHNYWQPLVATTATSYGVRGAIWIATNADPCNTISVSTTFPATSVCVVVGEFNNLPVLVGLDGNANNGNFNSTGGSVSYPASTAVWAFGLAVTANNSVTVTAPGSPWTALPTDFFNDPLGTGNVSDLTITPVWQQVSGAGTVTANWTIGGTLPGAFLVAGITQAAPVVTNAANPNWPVISVQAAFGANVGDGQTPWTWTDITSYAIHDSGSIIDAETGRSYELAGPESGTIQLWLNNQTGVFNPSNTSSPFYPNIRPETPIRIIATWANEVFPVAYGFVDKWPQTFDTPQMGFVNTQASDAMGVLANLTMYSALQSEILFDQPYAYWPLGDSYGEANGEPFLNLGSNISNSKPLVGVDGQSTNSGPLATGQSINLQGDTGTGIGLNGLTANPLNWSSGAIYVDPGLSSITVPNSLGTVAFSVEYWAVMPSSAPSGGSFTTAMVSLLGASTNFGSGGGPVRFQAAAQSVTTTTYRTIATLADFSGNTHTFTGFSLPNDGNAHHHAFVVQLVSGTWTVTHFLDGVQDTFGTTAAVGSFNDLQEVVVGPAVVAPLNSNPYNYTIAHVAIFDQPLNVQRIFAHYTAGANGYTGDWGTNRFMRIMAWSGSHLPMAVTMPSGVPQFGPAFAVGGQTGTDALGDMVVSEGGWPYADAAGNAWWLSRQSLYNRAPKWVFGDNPAGGEIPYDPGENFDYDNSFLYTQTSATRVLNQTSEVTTNPINGVNSQSFQNTGAIVRSINPAAANTYGNRNSLDQSVLTTSDQDVYDRVNWNLNKYGASALRIPTILINAAENPSRWPVVLGVEQGDIVQINRRPLGGAPYLVTGIVIKKKLEIGVSVGQVTLSVVPYSIEAAIIQADVAGYNTLQNGIGW